MKATSANSGTIAIDKSRGKTTNSMRRASRPTSRRQAIAHTMELLAVLALSSSIHGSRK